MTLRDLFNWHCQQGDRWHRLAEEEQSCGPKRLKLSVRRTYARKAAFHKEAAACLQDQLTALQLGEHTS